MQRAPHWYLRQEGGCLEAPVVGFVVPARAPNRRIGGLGGWLGDILLMQEWTDFEGGIGLPRTCWRVGY